MSAVFSDDIKACAKVINDGGVVICPTEGVYGLSCSADNDSAAERIISLKHRDASKGLIIVSDCVESLNMIIDERALSDRAKSLMDSYWPGPHTFIVKCRDDFSGPAIRKDHTAAIRVTAYDVFSQLCRQVKTPVISTSANISGHQPSSSLKTLDKALFDKVDFVLTLPCQGLECSTSIYDTIHHRLLRAGPNFKENI